MRSYIAMLGEKRHRIEIDEVEEGKFSIKALSQNFSVDVVSTKEGLSLLIDGRSVQVTLYQKDDCFWIETDGHTVPITIDDEQRALQRRSNQQQDGKVSITSPMPGRVVRILVKEGEDVKEKQGLVVLEAMKMENELKSPKDGKVAWIISDSLVGSTIEGGKKLVVVE